MSKIDSLDLLIIRAHKNREYLYDGTLTKVSKDKRKEFYNTFTKIIRENHKYDLTEKQVKARWRKLREHYVSADRQVDSNQLTGFLLQLKEECAFLKPFIKHNSHTSDGSPQQSSTQPNSNKDNQCKLLDEKGNDISSVSLLDFNNEQNYSDSDSLYDNVTNAEECQYELEALCQEAIAENSSKRKRSSLDNLEADFPKKIKKNENLDTLDSQIDNVQKKISELSEKNNLLLKARARALLVCSYLDSMTPNLQIICLRRIIEIVKKYQ